MFKLSTTDKFIVYGSIVILILIIAVSVVNGTECHHDNELQQTVCPGLAVSNEESIIIRKNGGVSIDSVNYLIDMDLEVTGHKPNSDAFDVVIENILCKTEDCILDFGLLTPVPLKDGSRAVLTYDIPVTKVTYHNYTCDTNDFGWVDFDSKVFYCNSTSNLDRPPYEQYLKIQASNDYMVYVPPSNNWAFIAWNTSSTYINTKTVDVSDSFRHFTVDELQNMFPNFNHWDMVKTYGNHTYILPNKELRQGMNHKLKVNLRIDPIYLPLKYSVFLSDRNNDRILILDPEIIDARTWTDNEDFTNGTLSRNITSASDEITLSTYSAGASRTIVGFDTTNQNLSDHADWNAVYDTGGNEDAEILGNILIWDDNYDETNHHYVAINLSESGIDEINFLLQMNSGGSVAHSMQMSTTNVLTSIQGDATEGVYITTYSAHSLAVMDGSTWTTLEDWTGWDSGHWYNYTIHDLNYASQTWWIDRDGNDYGPYDMRKGGNSGSSYFILFFKQSAGNLDVKYDNLTLSSSGTSATYNYGLYQDLQGQCPQTGNTLTNFTTVTVTSATGSVLLYHNQTNASLSTSQGINLTVNGTYMLNFSDYGYSTNDCVYMQYEFFDDSGDDSPSVTSYTISEATGASVPGNLSVVWDSPLTHDNHTYHEIVLYSANITCTGGNCGNVNVTIDPVVNYTTVENGTGVVRIWDQDGWFQTLANETGWSLWQDKTMDVQNHNLPSPQGWYIGRLFMPFNTSTLHAESINNITLWFNCSGRSGDSDTAINVFRSSQSDYNLLQLSDYDTCGEIYYPTELGVPKYLDDFVCGPGNIGWHNISLNKIAIDSIVEGGITQFCFRLSTDYNNSPNLMPDGIGKYVEFDRAGWFNYRLEINYEPVNVNKGIIPVGSGSPFYTTNTTNPTSACGSMNEGDTCRIGMAVNATGSVGNNYEFFWIIESDDGTVGVTNSSRLNITIIDNKALTTPNNITIDALTYTTGPDSIYINYSFTGDFKYTRWFTATEITNVTQEQKYNYTGLSSNSTYNITVYAHWNSTVYDVWSQSLTTNVTQEGSPPSISINDVTNLTGYDSIYINYSYSGNFTSTEWFNSTTLKSNDSNVYYNYTGLINNTEYNITFLSRWNSTVYDIWSQLITTAQWNYCTNQMTNTTPGAYVNTSCTIYDLNQQERNYTRYDASNCGNVSNVTYYEYQNISCDYCFYNNVNTSFSAWGTDTDCDVDYQEDQKRNKTEYDSNYSSCYAVTSIASDLWNGGLNITWNETQSVSCCYQPDTVNDFLNITYNVSWIEFNWTLVNMAVNYSMEIANVTQAYSETSPYNYTGLTNNTNYCFSTRSFNTSCLVQYGNYSNEICTTTKQGIIPCQNDYQNTSWTAWTEMINCTITDLEQENRSYIRYDANNCGNFTNVTYWDMQNVSCNYCTLNDIYSGWSDWTNNSESCGYRNRTSFDMDFSTCCNLTNITTDCWQDDVIGYNTTYLHTELSVCSATDTGTSTGSAQMLFVILGFVVNYFVVYRKNKLLGSVFFFALTLPTFSISFLSVGLPYILMMITITNLLYEALRSRA